jgi:Uma2 family endonuclease
MNMSLPERDLNRKYTYQDYLNLPEDERWELIDGVPYAMSPAPSRKHQRILNELSAEFAIYLRGKTCESYPAPFEVRLFAENETDDSVNNVVQPDIVVVCDPSKLDDRGCKGAPDLIVEILSSNWKHDRWTKYKLYERAGVREYWIVDPDRGSIEVFALNANGKYEISGVYGKEDELKVGIFEDLTIDLNIVFS